MTDDKIASAQEPLPCKRNPFVGVALLLDAPIEALFRANRFQARARDHHRLGPTAGLVPGDGLEVLGQTFKACHLLAGSARGASLRR